MSVASPVIDYIDPVTRRIYLLPSVRSFHPLDDIYAEVRNLRRLDEDLRNWNSFVSGGGNIDKGGGKFTPRYLILLEGTKIVPANVSHTLTITGEFFTDNPADPDQLDMTLVNTVQILANYQPAEAEVIQVGGGSALTVEETRDAVWNADRGLQYPSGSIGEKQARTLTLLKGEITDEEVDNP